MLRSAAVSPPVGPVQVVRVIQRAGAYPVYGQRVTLRLPKLYTVVGSPIFQTNPCPRQVKLRSLDLSLDIYWKLRVWSTHPCPSLNQPNPVV